MASAGLPAAWHSVFTALQRLIDRLTKHGRRPPSAGVREPRRPRPTLPAAAVALEEPRATLKRRIRLTRRRP